MSDPKAASSPTFTAASSTPSLSRRRGPQEVESEASSVPVEQRALMIRLSQEVAALRSALDVSRHRIAQLEVEAAEDPISGLLNQRAFQREIEKASAFHSRYRTTSAVALIGLDGIGGIAERHGRRVLNRLLRTIGDRLRAAIRSCDVAARIDPYQFGVVLWNATASDCEPRLALVRAAVGGMDRIFEGRVAAITVRSAVTEIDMDDTPDTILLRLEVLLGGSSKPVRP